MNNVDEIIKSFPKVKQEQLIPILQEVQEKDGFISEEAVIKIGKHLNLATSKIYGVATFYNQFRFTPLGKYNIQICRGTACHVLGSAIIQKELEKILNIKAGQTTRDGLFSIELVACLGACGIAPAISVNGEFYSKVTTESLKEIIESYKNLEK